MQPMELDDGPQPEGYGAGRAATILVAGGAWVRESSPCRTSHRCWAPVRSCSSSPCKWRSICTPANCSRQRQKSAERRTNYEACRSTTSALWDFVDDTDNIDWDTGSPNLRTTRPRDMLELAQGLDAGRPLRALVASAWYGNLVLILAQYLVVMARSLRVAFPLPGCAVVESLLIAALTAWLIAQLPTLDALSARARRSSASRPVLAILAICARHTRCDRRPPPVADDVEGDARARRRGVADDDHLLP